MSERSHIFVSINMDTQSLSTRTILQSKQSWKPPTLLDGMLDGGRGHTVVESRVSPLSIILEKQTPMRTHSQNPVGVPPTEGIAEIDVAIVQSQQSGM